MTLMHMLGVPYASPLPHSLNKELTLYKKEAEEQTRKLEARKAEGADGADIRHEVFNFNF